MITSIDFPVLYPFPILIMLLILSFFLNIKVFLINVMTITSISYIASFFIAPSFDHFTFVNYVNYKYISIKSILLDNYHLFSFLSVFAFTNILIKNLTLSVCFSNSLFISGTMNFGLYLKNKIDKSEVSKLKIILLIIFSPVVIQLLLSLNKDIPFVFLLSFILFIMIPIVINFIKYLFINASFTNYIKFFTVYFCISLFFSLLHIIFYLRFHYFYFLIVSLFISFLVNTLYKVNKIFTSFISYFIFSSIIISFFLSTIWQKITINHHENRSNAIIFQIHQTQNPESFFDAIFYSFNGYFYSLFGIFINPFIGVNHISLAKQIAGIIDSFVFLYVLLIFINNHKKMNNNLYFNLLLSFVIFHIGFQIWGTPNYGNLFRQRIIDFLLMLPFLSIERSVRTSQKVY